MVPVVPTSVSQWLATVESVGSSLSIVSESSNDEEHSVDTPVSGHCQCPVKEGGGQVFW